MLKSEKGMTLITLVLAIIVLLALAGIVVFLVFGKNGIASQSPVVVKTQDKNYAKNIVTVGLKAVREQAITSSSQSAPTPLTNNEKMDKLILFLDNTEFSKESETTLIYSNDGIKIKVTVDFDNYIITKVE